MGDEISQVPDSRPNVSYVRYVGDEVGPVCTPLLGEVQQGGVYRVTDPETAAALRGHSDYQTASERDFTAQHSDSKEQADA